jgi:hypothetical protein
VNEGRERKKCFGGEREEDCNMGSYTYWVKDGYLF